MTDDPLEHEAGLTHSFRRNGQASFDRLPPHSIEAEQGVLGCCLLDGEACEEALEGLPDEAFYDLRHQHIFGTIRAMLVASVRIDPVTMVEALRTRHQLDACGGMAYIATLLDCTPTAGHVKEYIAIVQEKYLERSIIQTCTAAVARIYEGETGKAVLDGLEGDLVRLTLSKDRGTTQDMKKLVPEAIQEIERCHQLQGKLSGISSGYPDLDKMTGGFEGGDLIVIAARPARGKTSIAMNMAEHCAIDQKMPVGVFSMEMKAARLVTRIILSRSRVNSKHVRQGVLTDRDFPKINAVSRHLIKAPVYIDDQSAMTVDQFRTRARRMVKRLGIKLFVIDYLQFFKMDGRRGESKTDMIEYVTKGIKSFASEANVPIILLSQMNREIEKEKKRRPQLSDVRGSGSIEQDADFVGFLHSTDTGEDDQLNEDAKCELIIAKQRNGPTGIVNLIFRKQYTRFESAARMAPDPGDVQDALGI